MRHYRVIGLLDIKPNDKGGFVADNTATRKLAGVAEQVEKGLAQLREIGLQCPERPGCRREEGGGARASPHGSGFSAVGIIY
jgi:hypothetical protein